MDITDIPEGHWLHNEEHATLAGDEAAASALVKYETPVAALKGGVEAQRQLGKTYRLPEDLAGLTDEQRAELLDRTAPLRGVPDKPEGYEIIRPNLPDGLPYDENMESTLRDAALKHKASPGFVKEVAEMYNKAMLGRYQERVDAANKAAETLKSTAGWGIDYDGNLEGVQRLLETYAGDSEEEQTALRQCLDETKLGSNVPLLKALHKMYVDLLAEGKTFAPSQPQKSAKGTLDYSVVHK
jgi:hypothetical protein